jgi:hypothetical protein
MCYQKTVETSIGKLEADCTAARGVVLQPSSTWPSSPALQGPRPTSRERLGIGSSKRTTSSAPNTTGSLGS